MFAKMKTGTRVLAGFGFALTVAMVVGAIGYQGMRRRLIISMSTISVLSGCRASKP